MCKDDELCLVGQLLERSFLDRDYLDKKLFIMRGKPRPELKLRLAGKKQFSKSVFDKIYATKKWITGCEKLNKLFCWPCLLFSESSNVWRTNGFDDLKNISSSAKSHVESSAHMASYLALQEFVSKLSKTPNLAESADETFDHDEQVAKNRNILTILMDAIVLVVQQGWPLVSKDPTDESVFVSLLQLATQFSMEFSFNYESSTLFKTNLVSFRDSILSTLNNMLISEVKREISESPFVVLILEESDVPRESYLSIIFRIPLKTGQIVERFVGFDMHMIIEPNARLFQYIKSIVDKFDCANKLIGWSHNGFNKNVKKLEELNTLITSQWSHVFYYHCHNDLNWVLTEAVWEVSQCSLFFFQVQSLDLFLSQSSRRRIVFESIVAKNSPSSIPIVWCPRTMIHLIMEHRTSLFDLCENILESKDNIKWDDRTMFKASNNIMFLEDFSFVFLLRVFCNILMYTGQLCENLQQKDLDADSFVKSLNNCISLIEMLRDDQFEDTYSTACFEQEPPSEMKWDRNIRDVKTAYNIIYIETHNEVIKNLEFRFRNIGNMQFLTLLNCSKFTSFVSDFPEDSLRALNYRYGGIFDIPKLKKELKVVYSTKSCADPDNLRKFLEDDAGRSFSEVVKLCSLGGSLLPLTETYDGSPMTYRRIISFLKTYPEDKLSDVLSVIAVEMKLLQKLKEKPNFKDRFIKEYIKKDYQRNFTFLKEGDVGFTASGDGENPGPSSGTRTDSFMDMQSYNLSGIDANDSDNDVF